MATRVLINEAALYGGAHGGIARYLRHLIEAAASHYRGELAFCSPKRLAAPPARWIPVPRFRGSTRLHLPDIVATAASAVLRPALYFGGYYGSARTSAPEVYTVYDLIHEMYESKPTMVMRRELAAKRRCLERAAGLIAISHNTASDIVRFYPHIDPAKIVVTHLGTEEVFFHPKPFPHRSRRYFIFVGGRWHAKNFRRLIIAFGLSELSRDLDLLVVSRSPFSDEERELMNRCGVADRVELRQEASDAELAQLYAGSVALVYPSEYEGFGLPIVEAMAAGTLVATSFTASMPEAGGEVAFYFDPKDAASIAEAMRTTANLPAPERVLRQQAGIRHARSFSWLRCQEQTLAFFDRLLTSQSP